MAKRKSMNRRLSRYSRFSTGSGILDPDTNILGEEHSYWWKNLENNTIARPSAVSSLLNQTSPHLNATSRIETSDVEDGWWKVLETSNASNVLKTATDKRKKDASRNIESTSESEEEPRFAKRKLPLRSEARKSQSNAFLSALNHSRSSVVSEPSYESKKRSIRNNSESSNRVAASSVERHEVERSSLNHSQSAHNILKLKPVIFRKKHGDRNKNMFDDVLQDNEAQSPLRRKTLGLSSVHDSQILSEHKMSAANDEASITSKAGTIQFALSFENEHDFSHFPVPNAQSTILDSSILGTQDSNKEMNNSDTETIIMKPKSKFLKRHKRSIREALFEDVLEDERVNDHKAEETLVTILDGSISGTQDSNKETNNSDTEMIIIKPKPKFLKRHKRSIREALFEDALEDERVNDHKAEETLVTILDGSISGTQDSNKETNNSDTETIIIKPKPKFLKRHKRSIREALFEDALEDERVNDHKAEEPLVTILDGSISGTQDSNKETNSSDTEMIIIKPKPKFLKRHKRSIRGDLFQGVLEDERVNDHKAVETLVEGNGTAIKETVDSPLKSPQAAINIIVEENKTGNMKRSRTSVLAEEKHSNVSSLQNVKESVQNNSASDLSITSGNSSDTIQDVPKAKSKFLTRPRRSAAKNIFLDILEDDENVNVFATPKIKVPSHREESMDLKNVISVSEIDRRSTVGRGSVADSMDLRLKLSSSSNEDIRSIKNRISESRKRRRNDNAQCTEVVPEKNKQSKQPSSDHSRARSRESLRSSQNIPEEKVRSDTRHDESTAVYTSNDPKDMLKDKNIVSERKDARNSPDAHFRLSNEDGKIPKRSNGISNRSYERVVAYISANLDLEDYEYLSFRDVSGSEPDGIRNTSKRQSKRLSDSRKQSAVCVASETEPEDVQGTPKKETRSSRSLKLPTLRSVSGSEADEVQNAPTRRSKRSSSTRKRSSLRAASEFEQGDVHNGPNMKTRSSRSQKKSVLPIVSESETNAVQSSPSRQTKRSSSLRERSTLLIASESQPSEIQGTPKRQSRNVSSSQTQLDAMVASESQKQVQSASTRQKKKLSRSKKSSILPVASESDSDEAEDSDQRQSRNLNLSQKQLTAIIANESKVAVRSPSTRRSGTLSGSKKSSVLPVASESESDEAEDTKKKESRNLTRSRKQSITATGNESKVEVQSPSKRQSQKLSRSKKSLILPVTSKSETEVARKLSSAIAEKVLASRQSDRASRSRKTSEVLPAADDSESAEAEDISKCSVSEAKKREDVAKGQSRNLNGFLEQSRSLNKSGKRSNTVNGSELEMKDIARLSEDERKSLHASEKSCISSITEETISVGLRNTLNELVGKAAASPVDESDRDESLSASAGQRTGSANKSTVHVVPSDSTDTEDQNVSDGVFRNANDITGSRNKEIANEPQRGDEDTRTDRRAAASANVSLQSGTKSEDVSRSRGKDVAAVSRRTAATNRSSNVSKNQKTLNDFFSEPGNTAPASEILCNREKMEEINRRLEALKKREFDRMKVNRMGSETKKAAPPFGKKSTGLIKGRKPPTEAQGSAKQVHRAFLVNGQVYKAPRLIRPKSWVTDRLYKYLWNRMEARYKLDTRIVSEKFVRRLSDATTSILRKKSYATYKVELHALMKEMARLGIIRTRLDFYHFCHDFLPYEIRVKATPMLLPGNRSNIPYDPEKLHEPLLRS